MVSFLRKEGTLSMEEALGVLRHVHELNAESPVLSEAFEIAIECIRETINILNARQAAKAGAGPTHIEPPSEAMIAPPKRSPGHRGGRSKRAEASEVEMFG